MTKQDKKKEKKSEPSKKDDVTPNPAIVEKGKKIKEDVDNLIDEIDDILEENAEEFVKGYIQKGGE